MEQISGLLCIGNNRCEGVPLICRNVAVDGVCTFPVSCRKMRKRYWQYAVWKNHMNLKLNTEQSRRRS